MTRPSGAERLVGTDLSVLPTATEATLNSLDLDYGLVAIVPLVNEGTEALIVFE